MQVNLTVLLLVVVMERKYGIHKDYGDFIKARIKRCHINLQIHRDDPERCMRIQDAIYREMLTLKQYKKRNDPNSPWNSNSYYDVIIE